MGTIPLLDLAAERADILEQLRDALFHVGFVYIKNHGIQGSTISNLIDGLPALFDLPVDEKKKLSQLNSPHFLGYIGLAEETTEGQGDLREKFDFATELDAVWVDPSKGQANGNGAAASENTRARDTISARSGRDFTRPFWRLRGPNQWPPESTLPGFRTALTAYHDALEELSYRFVHLVEEAFGIPVGTFDHFFQPDVTRKETYLRPQHRMKLLKYPPAPHGAVGQGVGAHKDSTGWLTFLYQLPGQAGLEVLAADGEWISAPPIPGTFVVNFGNAFEAATDGAVKATVHRVRAPPAEKGDRYSVPFFMGLPLDLTVSEVREGIPESVKRMRREKEGGRAVGLQIGSANGDKHNHINEISSFLDERWDGLGESQLKKWIRSHVDVGTKWYGGELVDFYLK